MDGVGGMGQPRFALASLYPLPRHPLAPGQILGYMHDQPLMRHPTAWLLPFLVVFVALTIWFPKHPSDERGYVTLARNLTHAQYTGLGWRPASPFASPDAQKPDLWFGPGLPLVLAPLVAVDAPLQVLRLVGPFVLFGALLMFFRLLRLYVSERPALLGAFAL